MSQFGFTRIEATAFQVSTYLIRMDILGADPVAKLLFLVAGVLIGILGSIVTERIKRRYAKADEAADLKKAQDKDRDNVHKNVIRDYETHQNPILGNIPKHTWYVTPRWLEKDAQGQWRIKEWTQFDLIYNAHFVRADKSAGSIPEPITDAHVQLAIDRKEWLVFVEMMMTQEKQLKLTDRHPCDAETAHLFD